MKDIKVFACETAESFTKEICEKLELPLGKINFLKFENDNNFVQILETVREKDIYIVQTTLPPVNERIMELLITLDALKRASARRITVVIPYMMYSRSDKKDQPRVPITAKLMAKLIEEAGANRVITCDLHNPAIQAYFDIPCHRLTGQHILQDYFKEKNIDNMVVVATDAGSSKKAYKYSEYLKCPLALIDKRRTGNDDNAIAAHIIGDVKDKVAVMFDDEISTAGTITQAAKILKDFGAKEVYAACTHGIFCGAALDRIKNSPIKELITTNTVPEVDEKEKYNIKYLTIAPLFAEAIKRLNEGCPIGDLLEFYDYTKEKK